MERRRNRMAQKLENKLQKRRTRSNNTKPQSRHKNQKLSNRTTINPNKPSTNTRKRRILQKHDMGL
jgi:hypothetical protein